VARFSPGAFDAVSITATNGTVRRIRSGNDPKNIGRAITNGSDADHGSPSTSRTIIPVAGSVVLHDALANTIGSGISFSSGLIVMGVVAGHVPDHHNHQLFNCYY
jgi:hypothetical protein